MKYQIIEDNGGGLHLFIFDRKGNVIRGCSNLEYLSHADFMDSIEALHNGDDASSWEGLHESPADDYEQIKSYDFGWEVVGNEKRIFPSCMGRAARIAYGVSDEDFEVSRAATALGHRGGKSTSEAKSTAARANGRKGGRPRKDSR